MVGWSLFSVEDFDFQLVSDKGKTLFEKAWIQLFDGKFFHISIDNFCLPRAFECKSKKVQ